MTDFDFDELDKAVAGVAGPSADQSYNEKEEPVKQPTSEPVQTSQESTNTAKVAPAARRGSGRFMDVVHPSSDMRTRTSPAVVNAPSSAGQATSFVAPPTHFQKTDTSVDSVSETSDAPEVSGVAVGEWSRPLETPFLADAKVEKRPLGGFGPDPSQKMLDEPEEELILEAPDELRLEETTLPDPIDFAAHVAALSSEEEDTGMVEELPIEEPVEEDSEQTVEQLDELIEPEPSTPPVLEVKTSHEPVGPASITQQYTEKPTAEQESGAIYDTENYHQPLAPVAKKHSSVLTILGIIGLVILGAGAGVAFYFFVLPNF